MTLDRFNAERFRSLENTEITMHVTAVATTRAPAVGPRMHCDRDHLVLFRTGTVHAIRGRPCTYTRAARTS